MKNNKTILSSIEKKRFQYSAEFFSRGASTILKNSFKSDVFNKIKSKAEEVEEIKKKSKEKIHKLKKQSEDFKNKVSKFLLVGGLLIVSGWGIVNKIKSEFYNIKYSVKVDIDETEILNKYSIDTKLTKKTTEIKDFVSTNFSEHITQPVQSGMKSLLISNFDKLTDKRLQKDGLWGTLLPDFALASIWYLFSKQGYAWILNFLDVRKPTYFATSMTLYQTWAEDPTLYGFFGRNLSGQKGAKIVISSITAHDTMLQKAVEMTQESSWRFISSGDGGASAMQQITEYYKKFNKLVTRMQSVDVIGRRLKPEDFTLITLNYQIEKFDMVAASVDHAIAHGGAGIQLGAPLVNNPDRYKVKTSSEKPAWEICDIEGEPSPPKKKIHGRTVYYVADFYIDQVRKKYGKPQAEQKKQFLWIESSIDYVDFVLTDMQLHDSPQYYNMYLQVWNNITKANFAKNNDGWLKRQEDLAPKEAKDRSVKYFGWTPTTLAQLVQFVIFLQHWETLQNLNAVMTSRGMYDELMKETMGAMVLNGLQKELMNQRKLAEDFITDFINGKISYKQYKEQVRIKLKKILKEGPFIDIKNQFKLRRKEIESKIPYMLVKDKIKKILSDLKTIQASSVFGKINVITINKDTLKNNLRPNNKYGKYYSKEILGGIGGSLFDKTYLGVKEEICTDKLNLLNRTPGKYLAIWHKMPGSGGVGKPWNFGNNFYRWHFLADGDAHPNYIDEDNGYWDRTIGDGKSAAEEKGKMDYVWSEPTPKSKQAMSSGSRATIITAEYYTYGKRKEGMRYKNRYEMYGDDGKFYIADVWDYFLNNGEYVRTELISKQKSYASHAAMFHGQYDPKELDNIYITPSEIVINQILDIVDLGEKRKVELLEKRYEILASFPAELQLKRAL